MLSQLSEMTSIALLAVATLSIALLYGSASLSNSFSSLLLESSAADYDPSYDILEAKVLIRSNACACPSRMTTLVRSTASSATQLRRLFDLGRSPMAARRRTLLIRRWVFFLDLAKACLSLIDTTVRDSRDTTRAKTVTFYMREFFQWMRECRLLGFSPVWRYW